MDTREVTEKAVNLNGDTTLAGIVTLPASSSDRPKGVIFLNAGILHRIGSSRLHVKFARLFAASGYTCFRFDHSSIGDSGPRRGSANFEQAAQAEVVQIMDYGQSTYGIDQFMIFGLCSGADVGYEVAVKDARIVSLVQLDPWVFTTLRSRLNVFRRHFLPRLPNPNVWLRQLQHWAKKLFPGANVNADREQWYADPEYSRVTPSKDYIAKGLKILIDRGVQLYLIYSGGDYYGVYNYPEQYRDAFSQLDFGNQLRVEWLPDCTHLFTALDHQQHLKQSVFEWLIETGQLSTKDAPENPASYGFEPNSVDRSRLLNQLG